MGLDMYAFANHSLDSKEEPVEIAYWRKHNALHAWMEDLWVSKDCPNIGDSSDFNCVALPLTLDDLTSLEEAIKTRSLKPSAGFFFGSTNYSEEDWIETSKEDLDFIAKAKGAIAWGLEVYYDSWW